MNRLRIALVMVEPPLPFGNAAARWFYVLLRGLVERGHDVRAFATCSNAAEVATAAELFPTPEFNLRCYPHPIRGGWRAKWQTVRQPYSYMFSNELRRDLDAELARGVDVLHLEQLWSGWLGLKCREIALPNTHYLFSIDQSTNPPASGVRQRMLDALTHRAERRLLRAFPRQIALTDRLAGEIRRTNPSANVSVVPLAIDLKLYPFDEDPPRPCGAAPTVGLIGSFNWTPSLLAGRRLIERLWPGIRATCPQARLLVVGRSAGESFSRYLGKIPGLEIRSDVLDPIPHLREMDVLLYAPEVGSGIKVKVVEAMALGVPIVTNAEGVEGLPARDGIDAAIVDSDEDLVARAAFLLQQPIVRRKMRRAGRQLIEETCGANGVLDRLEGVYLSVVDRRRPLRVGSALAGVLQ